MKIKLDENFYINASDDMNMILVESRTGKDKEGNDIIIEKEHGYFGSIGLALKKYMKLAVNRKFSDAVMTIDEYEMACLNVLEDVLKIIPKKL